MQDKTKKILVGLGLIALIAMIASSQVHCFYGRRKSVGFEIGDKFFSLSRMSSLGFPGLYIGRGFSIRLPDEDLPAYQLFEGKPADYWEYQEDYIRAPAFEAYCKIGCHLTSRLLGEVGFGYTELRISKLYKCPTTSQYYAKWESRPYITYLYSIGFWLNICYVTIGYHYPYGLAVGLRLEW